MKTFSRRDLGKKAAGLAAGVLVSPLAQAAETRGTTKRTATATVGSGPGSVPENAMGLSLSQPGELNSPVPHDIDSAGGSFAGLAGQMSNTYARLLNVKSFRTENVSKFPVLRICMREGYQLELANVPSQPTKMNPRAVEQLLDQAFEGFELAARLQSEREMAAERGLSLLMDLIEYVRLEDVHQRSVEAGEYQEPIDEATGMSASEADYISGSTTAQATLQGLSSELQSSANNLGYAAAVPIIASNGYKPTTPDFGSAKKFVASNTFDNVANNPSFAAAGAAQFAAQEAATIQKKQVDSSVETISADVAGSKEREDVMNSRVEWLKKDGSFKRLRDQFVMATLDQKLRNTTESNGALNFVERVELLDKQIAALLVYALSQATAANISLAYFPPLPQLGPLPLAGDPDSLSTLGRWVTHVRDHLRCTSSCAVGFSTRVSVSHATGRQIATNLGKDLHFSFPQELTHNLAYVRLRGIQIMANDPGAEGLDVTITAPSGDVEVWTGTSLQTVHQAVPPVFCGRPCPIGNWWNADLLGVTALFNATPLGAWQIRVDQRPGAPAPGPNSDLFIDFQMVGYSPYQG